MTRCRVRQGHDYGSYTADGISDGASQVDVSGIPEAFDAVIPEVDASAGHIIAAFKDGISQAEFEALGSSWGYDFSRGIWSAVGSDGRQHVTDAGVEMMYQLEQAIISSGSLEAIGEIVGIDLSGGITQNGGQYMTQAGVDLLMALEAGLSPEQLIAISQLLGFDIANAIGTSGSAQGTTSGKIVDAVKGVIQALGSILVEFLASIFDNLDLPMGWGEKIAGQLRESNQIAVAAAKEGASDVTEAYKYDLESGAEIIKGTASKIPEGAADGIESGTPAVESAGQGLRDSIKTMFSNLGLDTAMAEETDGMIGTLKSAGPKAGEATKFNRR